MSVVDGTTLVQIDKETKSQTRRPICRNKGRSGRSFWAPPVGYAIRVRPKGAGQSDKLVQNEPPRERVQDGLRAANGPGIHRLGAAKKASLLLFNVSVSGCTSRAEQEPRITFTACGRRNDEAKQFGWTGTHSASWAAQSN